MVDNVVLEVLRLVPVSIVVTVAPLPIWKPLLGTTTLSLPPSRVRNSVMVLAFCTLKNIFESLAALEASCILTLIEPKLASLESVCALHRS